MRKNMAFINSLALSVISLCAAIVSCPSAGCAATVSANASATVLAPVTITKSSEVLFEKLSKNSFGSVIILGSSYEQPTRGNVSPNLQSATQDAATFIISNDANTAYSVTVPQYVTVNNDFSNDTTLNTFAGNPYGAYVLSGTNQIIPVTGKFKEGSIQKSGKYTGKLNITVYYN